MAKSSFLPTVLIILCLYSWGLFYSCKANEQVPALFVFGDSLVDVGNNNHLPVSFAKANFPHNGIDFPTKTHTGRFTNGKNIADLIADKIGIPTSPPYLSPNVKKSAGSTLSGISFASGGAGIFNGTDGLLGQALPISKQIEYYASVHQSLTKQLEPTAAQSHLSKSIFFVVIGSNDLLDYFGSRNAKLRKNNTPQQYVNTMASTLKGQLKRLYDLGARKFLVNGVGIVGCIPVVRAKNPTEECDQERNFWADKYNEVLKSVLDELKLENKGFSFSYTDTYNFNQNTIKDAATFGFTEVKAACCGLGKLNSDVPCLPIAKYCPNRANHVFWDLYHPTEAANRFLADVMFDGSSQYMYPINVKQLIAL